MTRDARSGLYIFKVLGTTGSNISSGGAQARKIYVGNTASLYFNMFGLVINANLVFQKLVESDNEDMSNSNEVAVNKFVDDAGNNGQVAIDQFKIDAGVGTRIVTLSVYDTKDWLQIYVKAASGTAAFAGQVYAIGKKLILPAVLPTETGMEMTP